MKLDASLFMTKKIKTFFTKVKSYKPQNLPQLEIKKKNKPEQVLSYFAYIIFKRKNCSSQEIALVFSK